MKLYVTNHMNEYILFLIFNHYANINGNPYSGNKNW